ASVREETAFAGYETAMVDPEGPAEDAPILSEHQQVALNRKEKRPARRPAATGGPSFYGELPCPSRHPISRAGLRSRLNSSAATISPKGRGAATTGPFGTPAKPPARRSLFGGAGPGPARGRPGNGPG